MDGNLPTHSEHASSGELADKRIRIAIVEDNELIQQEVADCLQAQPEFQVIGRFGTMTSALAWLETNEPDVMLVDLGLPDGTGLSIIQACSQRYPRSSILVLTVFGDEDNVLSSIQAGANGYILKSDLTYSIVGAVNMLLAGGSPISPIIARQILGRIATQAPPSIPQKTPPEPSPFSLSGRETQVLDLIARGYTYAEVATSLLLSKNTIQTYIRSIYEKLSVHSRTHAVNEARSRGLI